MLLATASAILILAVIAAAILFLRSYRPTPVSVVERALIPHGLRAKVNTDARLRLRLHQQRRAGRSHPADTRDVASVAPPVSAPVTAPAQRAHNGSGAQPAAGRTSTVPCPERTCPQPGRRAPSRKLLPDR